MPERREALALTPAFFELLRDGIVFEVSENPLIRLLVVVEPKSLHASLVEVSPVDVSFLKLTPPVPVQVAILIS